MLRPTVPYNYEALNLIYGQINPSITRYNSGVMRYWVRSLFDRMLSKIIFTVPENWRGDVYYFFKICLFARGFVVVSRDDEYGYFFQPCGLKGRDFYYQPTSAIVSNPRMQREIKLHEDGELLRISPDYMGTCDIVIRYAEELAQISSALDVALHNSKMAYMLAGRNKAAVNALKKMMDLISQGNPAVYLDSALLNDRTDKDSPFQLVQPIVNVKQSYIVTDLLKDLQTLINQFDAEIGIQTIPFEKAERLTQYEGESKAQDSQARLSVWMECLDNSIGQIKELYPEIELDYTIREGETADEPRENNDVRDDDSEA